MAPNQCSTCEMVLYHREVQELPANRPICEYCWEIYGILSFTGIRCVSVRLNLLFRYRSQRQVSQNLEVAALIKQIKGLKKEINELNQSVNGELKELRKEIQQSDRQEHEFCRLR